MLEAVKFPACISDLNTGLTNVDRDALSHFLWFFSETFKFQIQNEGKDVYQDASSEDFQIWLILVAEKPFLYRETPKNEKNLAVENHG